MTGKTLRAGPRLPSHTGTADALRAAHPQAHVVHYGADRLICPGFVDAHVHYPQTAIIASWGKRLIDWLNDYTFPEEMRLHDPAYAAQIAGRYLDLTLAHGTTTGTAVLFITAGGNQVDLSAAAALVGEPLGKADAALIRAQTGFAIGGVSPVGHVTPCRAWFDRRLLDFDEIWAAAGTPHHVFCLAPDKILEISGAQVSDFTALSK